MSEQSEPDRVVKSLLGDRLETVWIQMQIDWIFDGIDRGIRAR
jgi:hypothetical protein